MGLSSTPPRNPARPVRCGSDFHGMTALEAVALEVLPALIFPPERIRPSNADAVYEAFDLAEAFFAESERRHTARAVKDQEQRRAHTKEELKARTEGKAP